MGDIDFVCVYVEVSLVVDVIVWENFYLDLGFFFLEKRFEGVCSGSIMIFKDVYVLIWNSWMR